MNIDLQEYYDNRFDMFGSKGWKDLIEDLTKIKEVTKDINNCNSPEQMWKAKGELNLINWVLNLEELTTEAYDGLKDS